MNKWRIEYLLKNGHLLVGMHIGPETDSDSVARSILACGNDSFVGTFGENERHNLLVRVGEIVAIEISEWKGK